MKRLIHMFSASQDGQAVVELALAIPILLIVLFGIVDFGRAVNYWNDENHVANLGARFAAVGSTGSTCKAVNYGAAGHTLKEYVECEAGVDSKELQEGSKRSTGTQKPICVRVSVPTRAIGEPVTVTVKTEYSWLRLPKVLGGSFKVAQTTLTGSATMRLEQLSSSVVSEGSC